MQENYIRLAAVIEEVQNNPLYKKMAVELDAIVKEMVNLSMTNRFENGSANPDFIFWTETDHSAVDVPLWSTQRIWSWIVEGVEWTEDTQNSQESRLTDHATSPDYFNSSFTKQKRGHLTSFLFGERTIF